MQTPKTDWIADDFFELSDYERICENLVDTREFAKSFFLVPEYEPMEKKSFGNDEIYAEDMNAIENNLELLNNYTYRLNIGYKPEYIPNGHVPTYEEYNRIEVGILVIYDAVLTQFKTAQHLPVILNGARQFGTRNQYIQSIKI